MNNNNYIQETETVQQNKNKIEDYILLSQEDRQSHLDLTTDCQFHTYIKDYGDKVTGDLYSNRGQMLEGKKRLLEYLNIEKFKSNHIHLCHKCDNNSNKDKVCVNILHLYFGTAKENHYDIPENIRKEVYQKGLNSMSIQEKHEAYSKGGKIASRKLTTEMRVKGIQTQLENGKHISQTDKSAFNKKVECPYCGKIGQLAAMKTWHFDKCKFRP